MDNQPIQNPDPVSPVTAAPTLPSEPKRSLPKWLIAGIIVLVLLIVAGAGIYFLGKNQATKVVTLSPAPIAVLTPNPTTDPTANWKTYVNTKYNYIFKYPSNLQVNADVEGGCTLEGLESCRGISLNSVRVNLKGIPDYHMGVSVIEIANSVNLKSIADSDKLNNPKALVKTIKFLGLDAITSNSDGLQTIDLIKNNYQYELVNIPSSKLDQSILSTFKFTK